MVSQKDGDKMIIIESLDISEDSVRKVVDRLKEISFDKDFDETIDNINFYYMNDKDKSIFILYKDGYASIIKDELDNLEDDEIVKRIKEQLDLTVDE